AFSALTGYPASTVMGRNCRFLQGPDTDPMAVATLRRALAAGAGCTVTLRNYTRDGTSFWNEVTLAPLRDAAGQVIAYVYVGVQANATARVEAERQRTRQAAVLDATAEGIYVSRIARQRIRGAVCCLTTRRDDPWPGGSDGASRHVSDHTSSP
ncbi:MAG: PAS domain-containing protein, partial [Chloroflexi bacterium]|nr:PAS domain-containing protein [Chloroflexota bacterium]